MTPSFALSLDSLSGWRTTLARRLDDAARFLTDHELVDASAMVHVPTTVVGATVYEPCPYGLGEFARYRTLYVFHTPETFKYLCM